MADARLVQVADAVASHLHGLTLSQSFTASRTFIPHFEREKLTALEVSVFPRSDEATVATRTTSEHILTLDIVIRKPVDPDSVADLSGMAQLSEELADGLANTTQAGAAWTGPASDQLFALEILADRREYLTVLTITYLLTR